MNKGAGRRRAAGGEFCPVFFPALPLGVPVPSDEGGDSRRRLGQWTLKLLLPKVPRNEWDTGW